MMLIDKVCLLVAIIGIVMFLYGANTYSSLIGWSGFYLMVIAVIVWIILQIYVYFQAKFKMETEMEQKVEEERAIP